MNSSIVEEVLNINSRNIFTFTICRNKRNPIILFIHGGPGYGTSYSLSKTLSERFPSLFEKYTFILWDQRCAGESLSVKDLFFSSSVNDYITDTKLLCDYFLKKYQQQKLIITGHSWGSILGLTLSIAHPEIVNAYIGIGQVINGLEGEKISYYYALKKTQKNRQHLYRKILKHGPPPHNGFAKFNYLSTQRKILSLLGGFQKSATIAPFPRNTSVLSNTIFKLKLLLGMYLSVLRIWGNCLSTNFDQQHVHESIPIVFICGRYDFVTPTSLVIKYYRKLKNPKKLFVFDQSGHRPHLEEMKKFVDILENNTHFLSH